MNVALYKVFASGADETYLYLILDNKDDYTKVAGKLDSIHFILSGIFSISIGYLYAINKRYPFVISIIICTLALLMAVRLENVREYKKDIKTVKELSEEFFANHLFDQKPGVKSTAGGFITFCGICYRRQRVELFTGYDIYLSVCCGWNLIGKLLQRENHVDIEKPRS